ncbi:MAG: lipid A deacylase LpxR family protein [Lentimicrobiaceae bacterium]|nr:lipid A deacylase LpxR family protein [Lentimicrobiaceae bacterium]
MNRFTGILFLMLLLTVNACRQPDTPVSEAPPPEKAKPDTIITFKHPVVVFTYPTKAAADSMIQTAGAEAYYQLADKNGACFHHIRQLASKHKLDTWSGAASKFRFITSEGAIIETDLSLVASPWKVLLFNGNDAPVLANPDKAASLLKQTFKLKTRQSRPLSKTPALSSPEQISENNDPLIAREKPLPRTGLRETTIRLIIFPGESPPPVRNETDGIRIVNSYISPHHRFWLYFDNDMFANTDRYYTNGVVLGYTAPAFTSWQLNRLLIRRNRNSVVHSALSLHHAMFTPLTTKEPPTLASDRPYASTLFLRYSQTSDEALQGIRFTSAIEAGVIGDAALGSTLQRSVHAAIPSNDEPIGWETQIKNDLVLNYSIHLQKQVFKTPHTEIYAEGSASAGTLYTNTTIGINAIAGTFSPGITNIPANYNQLTITGNHWQYGIRGGAELRICGYDATLQGGLFNRHNIYALKPDEIERLVASLHLGLFARYKKLGLSISQFYLSPEFHDGRQHFWGQIGLQYGY